MFPFQFWIVFEAEPALICGTTCESPILPSPCSIALSDSAIVCGTGETTIFLELRASHGSVFFSMALAQVTQGAPDQGRISTTLPAPRSLHFYVQIFNPTRSLLCTAGGGDQTSFSTRGLLHEFTVFPVA